MSYIRCTGSICCNYWLQILAFSSLLLSVATIGSICGRIRDFLGLVDRLFLDVTTVHHGAVNLVRRSETGTTRPNVSNIVREALLLTAKRSNDPGVTQIVRNVH